MSNEEHCPACNGTAELTLAERELAIGCRKASVDHEFFRCRECGEEWLTPEQMDEAMIRASRHIRTGDGLLQAEEIREIRDSLGLTQQEFEKLLGVGAKTVVRWEKGTVFQNRSTDALLRVIKAVPDAVRLLADRHGAEVPALGAGAAQLDYRIHQLAPKPAR